VSAVSLSQSFHCTSQRRFFFFCVPEGT